MVTSFYTCSTPRFIRLELELKSRTLGRRVLLNIRERGRRFAKAQSCTIHPTEIRVDVGNDVGPRAAARIRLPSQPSWLRTRHWHTPLLKGFHGFHGFWWRWRGRSRTLEVICSMTILIHRSLSCSDYSHARACNFYPSPFVPSQARWSSVPLVVTLYYHIANGPSFCTNEYATPVSDTYFTRPVDVLC